MVQWNRLTEDAQKRILTLLIMSGGLTATRCTPPVICDPQPPPPTTTLPVSTPSATRVSAPTPTRAPSGATLPPIICDPQPPPSLTRSTVGPGTATPTPALRFQLRSREISTDPGLSGALVRGQVVDGQGRPLGDIKLSLRSGAATISSWTGSNGTYQIQVPNPGAYTLIVGGDEQSAIPLPLNASDVVTVEWVSLGPASQLPLAEIRSVSITGGEDLCFGAESLWTGAHYRWMVSGGSLQDRGGAMEWHPPSRPGQYLLQLIADWGATGIAVDTRRLTVLDDGRIYIS